MKKVESLILLSLILAGSLSAQVSTGSFSGRITDDSSLGVPLATVEVKDEGTGYTHQSRSDAQGWYKIEGLEPGVYSITADHEGFRTSTTKNARLNVSQEATVDVRLKAGGPVERVEVTANEPVVQAEDSSSSFLVGSQMAEALPNDGRNILSLVTLGPGVVPRQLGGFVHDVNNDVQSGSRGSVALNSPVNGARSNMNNYFLDGVYDTDRNIFAVAVIPPLESVQEFRTESSVAPIAFSQTGGGVVSIITKSGSHDYHGNVFEFLQNGATDANNYFDDPTVGTPVFQRNQYGATLGGPLPLKSTFFFAAYEGLYQNSTAPSAQLVPDAVARSGQFGGVIYDPQSAATASARTPFPNNLIPANRLDPIAQRYLTLFEPLPNRDNPFSNYLETTPSLGLHNSGSIRVDHQFEKQGDLFFRYTVNNDQDSMNGSFPTLATNDSLFAEQIVLGETAGRSNLINEFRMAFTRLRVVDVPKNAFTRNVQAELGIDNPTTDPFAFGVPYFVVSDYSTVTDDPALPQTQRDNLFNITDGITFLRGRHTIKLGADWVYFQFNYRQSNSIRGQYNYTGGYTAGADGSGGDSFADFLLGYPEQTIKTEGSAQAYMRENSMGAYVQDQWKVGPNLTLNLGLRYEYIGPYSEARNNMLNLDYSTLPAQPALVTVSQSFQPNYLNFAPRVGVAYVLPGWLSSHGQTVLRSGYGIYYSPEIATEDYDLLLNRLLNVTNTADATTQPTLTTANGFPVNSSSGFPSYFGLDTHLPTPYMQEWNFGLQHQFPGNVLFDVSYIGSKGTHLGLFRRFNTPLQTETGADLSPRPGDLQELRTFPDLGTIYQRQNIGNSSYNSLQIKAERTFGGQFSFIGSFVWAKSIDDATSTIVGLYDSAGAQDENNLRLERGLSFFDVRRRVSAAFSWNIPEAPALRKLLKGWQLNGIVTLQDGTPLDPIYYALDFANTGTPNRPDLVPGQQIALPASQRTPEHWFNTAAFTDPQPYTFGNAGRDIIPGPGNAVVDLSVRRRFALTERFSLTAQVDGFNTLNHPNLGIPGPYPDFGPLFGRILASGDPRRIQFGLRLEF